MSKDFTKYDLANKYFADYVEAITGRSTILRRADTPQPNKPYCSIITMDYTAVANDIVTFAGTSTGATETVRGLGLLTYVVEALGGDARSTLANLQASFQTIKFFYGMGIYGFGLSDKGTINNTSAPFIDAKFEERQELKCSFYHVQSEVFDADYFNRIQITTEFNQA